MYSMPREIVDLLENQPKYPKIAYYRSKNNKIYKIIMRNGAGMQLYDFSIKKLMPCFIHVLDALNKNSDLITDPKEIESIEMLYGFKKQD